jgi:putative ABC transport system permease protein
MAVRASLGASRRRLVQQLLTESAVLATLGGLAGTVLSLIGIRLVTGIIPQNTLAYYTRFTMDGRVLAVLCAICLGTVFVFGLAPAAHLSRVDVSHLMKDGGRSSTSGLRSRRWTALFLASEFGLTMVMLAALAQSVRVARSAERTATVIDAHNMLTASIALSAERYRSPDQRLGFYRQLGEQLAATPGISAAAVTTALPLGGAAARRLTVDGRTLVAGDSVMAWTVAVTPRYFEALRLPPLQGRAFSERDGSAGNESAIVNQRLASMLFPHGDAIGYRFRLAEVASKDTGTAWLTIVGISPNVRQRNVPDSDPVVYVPLASAPPEERSSWSVGGRTT